MKAALLVPRVTADPAVNLARIERMAADGVASGARLILLPEAVLTGLNNNDDPAHDLPLGQSIPGPATDRLGAFTRRHDAWLGFGLLEREGDTLYDSAVLLGSDGTVVLTYRRNQPQWHAKAADPAVYRQGSHIGVAQTPFGRFGFLLCGDLFDDGIVSRFRALRPDWLLFPFARCFPDGAVDQVRWDAEELPQYAQRVKLAQTPALMVNYIGDSSLLDDNSFGGAFFISAEGEVRARLPLGVEGSLIVELGGGPGVVAD
jgi:predicted amidohydrolase